jgi:alkaline phosphatase D
MSMDRRRFLKVSAAGAGALAATRLAGSSALAALADTPFQYGVASGDPRGDGFVIWTRVTPSDGATPGSRQGGPADVAWEVATDPRFRNITRKGTAIASARSDHTVKIDVAGLRPNTQYYYRFKAVGTRSPMGRAMTAAAAGASIASVRFGVASCSNYEGGFFSAYRHMADRDDLDFVLHLGDYLYEYAPGDYGPGPEIGRKHEPGHEIVSLADYRIRHALYKSDPDLQSLHGRYPFITTWDDHEVTNDTYRDGAENHQPDEEGNFFARRARAYQAYFEWMPIRLPAPTANPSRIYRDFVFGDIADLSVLDTRQYRDAPPENAEDESKDDPKRTLTGDPQMSWLKKRLASSRTKWHLIGNQVMVTPLDTGPDMPLNVDAWDGYRADRLELLQHLVDENITNVTFLTGDIHSSWACDVPIDADTYPVSPSVATELVGTSITSDNLDEITGSPPRTTSIAVEEALKARNRHIKFIEFDSHGYSIVDASRERLQMDWFYISDRTNPKATQEYAHSWQVLDGTNSVSEADEPIA